MKEDKKDVKQTSKKESPKKATPRKFFVVVDKLTDLQDNDKKYVKGDQFPISGKSDERIKELSTTKNRRNEAVIKEQE